MIKNLWNKISTLSKKQWLGIGALFFLLLLIFRSCNGPMIMNEKTFHIVRSNNWAPIELFGKEPNMGAFIDELITEIAVKEKLKINLTTSKELSPTGLFHLLDTSQYEAIIVTFSPSIFIKDKYLISDPIYNAGPVLIVPSSSTATSLKDLEGKAVGIKNRSNQAFQIGKESALLISYDNMISALSDLEHHIIAGVIMDAELAQIYTGGFYKGRLKVVTSPLTDLGLRLVAKKGKEEEHLIQKFNRGLVESEKNGVFERLIHKWGLTNP